MSTTERRQENPPVVAWIAAFVSAIVTLGVARLLSPHSNVLWSCGVVFLIALGLFQKSVSFGDAGRLIALLWGIVLLAYSPEFRVWV